MMRRITLIAAVVALVAGTLGTPPAAAGAKRRPYTPTPMPSIRVADAEPVKPPTDPTAAMNMKAAPKVVWPQATTAIVDLTGTARGTARQAGTLPIRVGTTPPSKADGGPTTEVADGQVSVQVLDRVQAAASGVDGILLRLSTTSPATVAVDYSGFRNAYGGDWAGRLRLQSLSAGVKTVSHNDVSTSTVSATVTQGGLFALTAGDSSSTGDFKATSLAASATWSAGGSSGNFGWSYPMRVPPSLGGPSPQVALSYSSQSTDGRTAAGNSQPSWIAEGFDFWPGAIERTYQQCSDDGQPATVYDLCWGGDNATLSMAGRGGELVQDNQNPNVWRPRQDDGSKVERISTVNEDNNGEAWLLTTQDGTRYYFGLNSLPGAASWQDTHSVFTVPVFGDDAGEPCNLSRFEISYCAQAYRWNLDYVVDPMGNTMSIWYDQEINNYARNHTDTAVSPYVRGGTINHIEYGTRLDNGVDSRFTTPAPMRVDFATADRCITAPCTAGDTANWPDVPWDRQCTSTTNCAGRYSATYWTTKRLASVTTRVWGTSDYRDVERWTLNTVFKDPGDGHEKILWLASLSHSGLAAGYAAVSVPDVSFAAVAMTNRVDINSTTNPIWRFRISSITNESGGVVTVSYSPAQCRTGVLMPASPQTNTLRCFPAIWVRPGESTPTLEYFHRYVVTSVTESDAVAQGPPVTVNYIYLDSPAWHYDDYEFVPPARRTYGQWRGYSKVRTVLGQAGTTQSQTDALYYRGMGGSIVDSTGASRTDDQFLMGTLREQITYTAISADGAAYGTGAPYFQKLVYEPWWYGPTATRTRNGVTVSAYVSNTGSVTTYTARDSGADRVTRTYSTYDNTTGRLLSVDDEGDTSTTADDRCLRTEYAQNTAKGMISYVARIESVAVRCAATPSRPAQVISDMRSYFDGATTFDKQVSAGKITKVEALADWVGKQPVYKQASRTVYDTYGRVIEAYDALNGKTATAYTPTSGGPTTTTKVTSPLGWVTTATLEPAWGLATRTVDPNGRVTAFGYDGLGRVVSAWAPGRDQAMQTASATFDYRIRNDVASSVATSRLNAAGTGYITSYEIYDGLLRPRQTQFPSATGTGRVITEIQYDFRGNKAKENASFYNANNPSGTRVNIDDASSPAQTVSLYDNAGRLTTTILKSYGVEKRRSSIAYGGDRVYNTPPTGGTALTSIMDGRGKLIEMRQHKGATPTGAYDATKYTYTASGDLETITDPAGNVWRYTYDLRGRRIKTEDPDAGTTLSTYDDGGRLTATTDGRLVTTSMEYDAAGRKVRAWLGAVGTGTKLEEWTYDTLAKGQLTSATRWDHDNAYTTATTGYDVAYRPTGTLTTIPAVEGALAGTYATTQTYNDDGTIATTGLPAAGGLPAETISYGYTPLGFAKTMTGATTYVTDTTYDAAGRLQETILSDGAAMMVKAFEYDVATGRLTRHIVWGDSTPWVLTDANYTYDAVGNVTAVSDKLAQWGGTDDNQCFRYDNLRRLTEAWTPAGGACTTDPTTAGLGGAAPYWLSYTYDAVGNRKSETNHASSGDTLKSYAYPAAGSARPHAITSVTTTGPGAGTTKYAYDPAGHTATRDMPAEDQTLTWNPEGQLAGVSSTTTGNVAYVYTAHGDRLIRRDATGTTLYIAGQQIRVSNGGTVTATRFYGEHATRSTDAGLSWTATDHQGTVSMAVRASDMSATVKRRTPFGTTRGPAPPPSSDRGFVGGREEPTGLVHLGAREYEADSGRFVSVDPVADATDPQQLQGYAYANNTPVTMADPSGEIYVEGNEADSKTTTPKLKPKNSGETPRGLSPGLGPKQNIYMAVVYDQRGNPIPYFVSVTDACHVEGPAICHNDTDRIFDVEFLGPATVCHHGDTAVPCYLGNDGAIHTLDRRKVTCADGESRRFCLPSPVAIQPNLVLRVHADLTGRNVFERRCPDPNEPQVLQPSSGTGYVPPPEDPGCTSEKCKFMDFVSVVDRWFGWIPVLGDVTAGMMALDDFNNGNYPGAAANALSIFTGKFLDKLALGAADETAEWMVKSGYAQRTLITNDAFAKNAASGTGIGAKMLCADVPSDAKVMGICLF